MESKIEFDQSKDEYDNKFINIIDPLSVIVKLAIISGKPIGTKIAIINNIIYIQEPGLFQSFFRIISYSNKNDLQYLYNPIRIACIYFLNSEIVSRIPNIKILFNNSLKGLELLMETYKKFPLLNLVLGYYYTIIKNYINNKNNNLFLIEDSYNIYYKKELITKLNSEWVDDKIKIILDLLEFNKKYNENPNLKSLETIMNSFDQISMNIIKNFNNDSHNILKNDK